MLRLWEFRTQFLEVQFRLSAPIPLSGRQEMRIPAQCQETPLLSLKGRRLRSNLAGQRIASRFAAAFRRWQGQNGLPCELEFLTCNFTCKNSVLVVLALTKAVPRALYRHRTGFIRVRAEHQPFLPRHWGCPLFTFVFRGIAFNPSPRRSSFSPPLTVAGVQMSGVAVCFLNAAIWSLFERGCGS